MNKLDLTGKKVGRLKVVREDGTFENGSGLLVAWLCECDCGKITRVRSSSLNRNRTQSCGCLCADRTTKRNTTHGKSRHPLYWKWSGIIQRGTGNQNFRFYGKRKIGVCKEWRRFENFYSWAKNKWKPGLDIDRIDTTLGYSPSNCRFVSRKINTQNTRRSKRWVVFGKQFKSSGDAARFYGCAQSHIYFLCHGRVTKTKTYYPEPFCYAVKKYPNA